MEVLIIGKKSNRQEFDLIAICDEVWEHVVFDGRAHIPLISIPGMRDRTVKIGSAGKMFGLTGWKIGFVCAAPQLLRVVAKAHQFITFTTAPNYNASASTTGRCASGDVGYGVISQGVELEASLVPARNFRVSAGLTYAKTKYRDNLVGNNSGAPLNPALHKLPGDNLSNAPEVVVTGSAAWTPDIGSTGLSALFYVDTRMSSDYNTGSDLFPEISKFMLISS